MKFRFIVIASCLFLICHFAYGQNKSQTANYGKIGLTFSSLGSNGIDAGGQLCDCGYDGGQFYDIGITYIYPINNWLGVETGIEYSKHTVQFSSYNPNRPSPNISSASDVTIVDIPLMMRASFLHYFFANAGLLLDIDASSSSRITNQSGIGQVVGIGAEYTFSNGIALFANPYFKYHASVPFKSGDHQKLMEGGFRFGITYSLQ